MDNKRKDITNNDSFIIKNNRRSRVQGDSVQRRSSRTGTPTNISSRKNKDDLLLPQGMRSLYPDDKQVADAVDTGSIEDITKIDSADISNTPDAAQHTMRTSKVYTEADSVRSPRKSDVINAKEDSFNISRISRIAAEDKGNMNGSHESSSATNSDTAIHRRRSSGTYYRDNVIQDDESVVRGKRKSKKDDLSANSINAGGFSRESHKKQANIKELIKIISVLLVILIMIIGFIVFYQRFHVSTISIIGSQKYSEKQLLSKSGIQDGAFILSYSREDIETRFNNVEDVYVLGFKRIFPDKLEIQVADRDASAAIPAGNGKYTIICADGYVINSDVDSAEGLITIRGLSGKSYAVGSYIDKDTGSAAELSVRELLKSIDGSALAGIVTAIDLSNTSCVKFEIGSTFTIVLGDCIEASENIETASRAYALFSESYPEGGIINVFSNSTIVHFTPARPSATTEPQ